MEPTSSSPNPPYERGEGGGGGGRSHHTSHSSTSSSTSPSLPPSLSSNVITTPSRPSLHSVTESAPSSPPVTSSGGGGGGNHFFPSGKDTPHSTPPASMSASGGSILTHLTGSIKRDSYKDRKKVYQKQKKKVAEELLTTIADPTVVVSQDWLKVRGSLKGWTKVWCELKPGLILLYKSAKTHKSGVWVGTILLNVCEVIERPSKKNGFCFKLFHPLEQSIWASKGPKGETFGALIQPLPTYFLIFRAPSEVAGRQWMEAIELSFRCSSLLVRSQNTGGDNASGKGEFPSFLLSRASAEQDDSPPNSAALKMNESEMEKHFKDHDLDEDEEFHSDRDDTSCGIIGHGRHSSDSDSDVTSILEVTPPSATGSGKGDRLSTTGATGESKRPSKRRSSALSQEENIIETPYTETKESDDFGQVGEATEEVAEENKSLLWTLLKQVRPGMDLSKVVLPTFILEPRSFLEKLSDYYYHCDILSRAVSEDDPFMRMKLVTKWYLSGFYKKPKGLKKPYNPILGETFRCYWSHPETGSRTFYLAEQISHHPPISAFHVTNRKDGFAIHGSILAKSKFYGNSVSAVLDGTARLSLLTRGEDYTLTMPYAHCKGILMGTLSLELGGKVEIRCERTGYFTEIEFKLKPFLGGNDYCNLIVGKIRLGKETLATLEGHWDTEIRCKDKKTGVDSILWVASPEVKATRLKRFAVPLEYQGDFESEKLWRNVTLAINRGDQMAATDEKTVLEEAQRRGAHERRDGGIEWDPKLFVTDIMTGEWTYRNLDSRPWDSRTDVIQYERDYVIQTKTRHKTPVVSVRTNSVVSIENTKSSMMHRAASVESRRIKSAPNHRPFSTRMKSITSKEGSGDSSPDHVRGPIEGTHFETTEEEEDILREDETFTEDRSGSRAGKQRMHKGRSPDLVKSLKNIQSSLEVIDSNQREMMKLIRAESVIRGRTAIPASGKGGLRSLVPHLSPSDIILIVLVTLFWQMAVNQLHSKFFG